MGTDCKFASRETDNELLQKINSLAINYLFKSINKKEISCLLLTGSVANCEGTVLRTDSSTVVASDFDFVVYMNLINYLRNRRQFPKLSSEISDYIVKNNVDTHVVFLPLCKALQRIPGLGNSSIYEYEFSFGGKCMFGTKPSLNNKARPTEKDALELTFTVIGDLIFSNSESLSVEEKIYVYSKRALTLLNSLLIFNKIFAITYKERITNAKNLGKLNCLSENELRTLAAYTDFKLSGELKPLLTSLNFSNVEDLIVFQKDFLKNFAVKILYIELSIFSKKSYASKFSIQEMENELPKLLLEYYNKYNLSFTSRFNGLALYLISSLSLNTQKRELFATFIFYNRSPKSILNIINALFLIENDHKKTVKILKEVFSWVKFSDESSISNLRQIWEIAQQSIKL